MIAEWEGKWDRPTTLPDSKGEAVEGPETNLIGIAGFLARCGKSDGIATLAKDLRKRQLRVRAAVVSGFGKAGMMSVSGAGPWISPEKNEGDHERLPKQVRVAIEALLVTELDDTAEQIGISGTWDGKNFADPRVCDVAGHVLTQLYADKYRFDFSAPLRQRDQSLIALKNVWRKENGLPPLPIPPLRQVMEVPAAKLQPLLDALVLAAPADRRNVEAQIEQLGLGALQGIVARSKKATTKDERTCLDRVARRVATIVDEATFAERPIKPSAELARKLAEMRGTPLDPDKLLWLVRSTLNQVPTGVHALRFVADRSDDGTGVTLKVHLLDKTRADELGRSGSVGVPKPVPGVIYGWCYTERVDVGSKGLHGGSTTTSRTQWQESDHASLRNALIEASDADPFAPISVRLTYSAIILK